MVFNRRRRSVFPFLSILVPSLFFMTAATASVLDRIVAVVEAQTVSKEQVKPRIITQSEVDEIAEPVLKKLRRSGEAVDPEKIRKRALDELINRTLRDQKAEQMGIKAEESDILALFSQVERNNKLPPGTLPQALASQGISVEKYRQSLRDKIIRTRLINRLIRPQVRVTDEEVDLLLKGAGAGGEEEIHLGQILLHVEATTPPVQVQSIRRKAQRLAGQLQSGTSLSSLAGQFSNDPSGLSGGDMGWFKRGQLQPELGKVVFDLEKGAIAGPIRSPQGFHIFQVLDRRRAQSESKVDVTARTKVKARHILLKVPAEGDDAEEAAVRERVRSILAEIRAGASFKEMAVQHSEDATAEDGGDLGWFEQGSMVPSFEEAAFSLEKGQISEPVRTPFGWHLIQLEDKKVLSAGSDAAKRKALRSRLVESKIKSRYSQWLRNLRSRAYVDFR